MLLKQEISKDPLMLRGAILLLLLCVVAFVITGRYALLAVPVCGLLLVVLSRNWKLGYWALLCSLPLSVKLELAGNAFSLSLPAQPIVWCFFLLAIFFVAFNPRSVPVWWMLHPLTLLVAAQFIWLIAAVADSTVLLLSLKFLFAKTWFLAVFFLFPVFVFKEKKDFRTALLLLLTPVLASIVVILIRHAMLGFRFSQINNAIGLFYYNHVEYSTILSMMFPLVCVVYPLTKSRGRIYRRGWLILVLLLLTALFFSYARAAILAILFSMVVGVAIKCRLVNWIMPLFYGAIALLMVYLIRESRYLELRPSYEHTYMHSDLSGHLTATFKGRDMSSMERLHRWIAAVRMSREKPLTGFGPHGFYYNYQPYTLRSFRTYVSANVERSTTHNYFLLMLTEQGYPAMILYGLLVLAVFAFAQRIYHRFGDRFYKCCTLGVAMCFAACFVNNFFSELVETQKIGALFYLCLALLVILDSKSRVADTHVTTP